jgi:hypothetical protein
MHTHSLSTLCALNLAAGLLVGCGGSTTPSGSEGVGGSAGAAAGGGSSAGTTNGGAIGASGAANGGAIGASGAASGGAIGASGAASGGAPHGGSSGAASGGAPHGGSSGAASGGAPHGGASGAANGGAQSGGAGQSTPCSVDTDCVDCAYPTAPAQASDCYCANCALTPLLKPACASNQAAWQAECRPLPRACPAIACLSPAPPVCKNGVCSAVPRTLPEY